MAKPATDTPLFEIMYTCRAMRRLKPDPVPEATLLQLVDAALQAPSGSNAQLLCVAQDEEQARMFASPATLVKMVRHFGVGTVLRSMRGLARTGGLADGASAYPAVQNLLLAARALGLGAVLTTQFFFVPGEFEAVLGIPSTFTLAAVVPVGWPTGKFGPVKRPDPAAVVRWDRWKD